MSDYIICDAGGTKALFILFSGQGVPKAVFRSSGANALFLDQEASVRAVETGIRECLRQGKVGLGEVNAIVLFIPGFSDCLPMLKKSLPFDALFIQSDHVNASYGALGDGVGITILSGTGSFATGKDRKGKHATVGGWGPLIGDYGSGYHIGLQALARLAQQADEGKTGSVLESLVLSHLNLVSVGQFRRSLYRPMISRAEIARLSFAVSEAAAKSDPLAVDIIRTAASHLADLAVLVATRIDSDGFNVTLTGGIANMGDLIVAPLKQEIATRLPQCTYLSSKYPPAIGAVLYVLDMMEKVDIGSPSVLRAMNTIEEMIQTC